VKNLSSLLQVASSLLIPIAIGLSSFTLLAALVDGGIIQHELFYRYMFGHWVNRTTSALFCIGAAGLALAIKDVLGQYANIRRIELELPAGDSEKDDGQLSRRLLAGLDALPTYLHSHYLHQRLRSLFEYISRSGATAATEPELRFLSQQDEDRKHARYSFVRILIWAIPLLGFLGTVLGISEGLGKLGVSQTEDLSKMMSGLQASLYVAFDTTAQALVLSIGLMFTLYLSDRLESQLLRLVDDRALELVGEHFEFSSAENEASLQVSQLGRRMLAATRSAVREQTDLWRETLASAEQAWSTHQHSAATDLRVQVISELEHVTTRLGHNLELAVANSLEQSQCNLENLEATQSRLLANLEQNLNHSLHGFSQMVHGTCDRLDSTVASAIEQSHQLVADQLALWQASLAESNRLLTAENQQTVDQLAAIRDLAGRLEDIASLQETINRGLDAVTSTSRMDYALTDLATAIKELRQDLKQHRQQPAESPAQSEPRVAPFSLRLHDVARRVA
jgi:biopolymer transport protein ExbB/TolQ